MSDISFGIKLKFDGKEVDAGVSLSREHLREFATDVKRAGEAASGGFTSAAQGVRSVSEQLQNLQSGVAGSLSLTQGIRAATWVVDQASAMQQMEARLRVATTSALDCGSP